MSFASDYLAEAKRILEQLDADIIERMVSLLVTVRTRGGRLFILGVGGGAGHASHAVNDFRKIAGIEAYAPTDNVPELTARINDDGWPTVFKRRRAQSTARDAGALTLLRPHSTSGGGIVKRVLVTGAGG